METLGGYAFYGCTKLNTIAIPDSVTALVDVSIPENVSFIGSQAFYGCSSLRIPGSVTEIGTEAFSNCGMWSRDLLWKCPSDRFQCLQGRDGIGVLSLRS